MAKPELRFPEFTDEWENQSIGELCSEFKSGKNIKADDIEALGKYPVYGGNGLRGYTDRYNHEGTYALIGRQGALCGNTTLVNGKNFFTEHAIAVQGNEDNDTVFLFYLLGVMKLGQYSGQSAQPGLAVNKLIKLNAIVPVLSEQQKIADFLSSVDDMIQIQEEEISALEEQKKGVMQKIFNREVRFKADDGSEYPEWEEKSVGEICTSFSGGTPKSGEKAYYNGNINFIRSGEIHSDKTELTITEKGVLNSSAKIINKGDILLALYGATSGEVDISKMDGAINQAILCIRPFEQYVKKYLVEMFIYSKRDILNKYLQGGQGNLSAEIIKKLKYQFPIKDEQQKIADCLWAYDEMLQIKKEKLEIWKEIKKGLLQQMFV